MFQFDFHRGKNAEKMLLVANAVRLLPGNFSLRALRLCGAIRSRISRSGNSQRRGHEAVDEFGGGELRDRAAGDGREFRDVEPD